MTANLTRSALGGSSAATNREYIAVDTESADVSEMVRLIDADWARQGYTPQDPALLVSPVSARPGLARLIAASRTSLDIEAEELLDPIVADLLAARARQGIRIRLLLPATESGASSDEAALVRALASAGAQVHRSMRYYIHAKMITADSIVTFVGSENLSPVSLDENREVGLLVGAPDAVATVESSFAADWALSDPA